MKQPKSAILPVRELRPSISITLAVSGLANNDTISADVVFIGTCLRERKSKASEYLAVLNKTSLSTLTPFKVINLQTHYPISYNI